MRSSIKNIIFDLGGVIYHIDPQRTVDAFNACGAGLTTDIFNDSSTKEVLEKIGTGKVEPEHFFNLIRQQYGTSFTEEQIIDCWNALLIGIPKENLELLERLAEKYRLFLLSNTNRFHIQAANKYLSEAYGEPGLDKWFEKIYYSHEIGLEKPDPAIYRLVLDEFDLLPERTVFIDDSKANTEAATALGIQTIHHRSNSPLNALEAWLHNNGNGVIV